MVGSFGFTENIFGTLDGRSEASAAYLFWKGTVIFDGRSKLFFYSVGLVVARFSFRLAKCFCLQIFVIAFRVRFGSIVDGIFCISECGAIAVWLSGLCVFETCFMRFNCVGADPTQEVS